MRNQWLAYAIVAIISVGAGFAIAGPPDNRATPPTISAPATTVAPSTTVAPPETTTSTSTTEPVVETVAPTTSAAAPDTAATTTPELAPDAAEIAVVVVNGAGTQGLASRVRDELVFVGFEQARATDGVTLVDETVVYYFDDFEAEAAAIASFLEMDPELIRPAAEAPEFGKRDGDQVAIYLGRDRG